MLENMSSHLQTRVFRLVAAIPVCAVLGAGCTDGPQAGGQTGSEISCESHLDCTDALGSDYRCGDEGVCVEGACPDTCAEFCPQALDCTLPEGCENPGCGCPEADCSPTDPVCPQTCAEFCPQALDCTLPEGCENPGCGCPEADCG